MRWWFPICINKATVFVLAVLAGALPQPNGRGDASATTQAVSRQSRHRTEGKAPKEDRTAPKLCQAAEPPATLDRIPEASGVSASRRTPGLLWINHDSGEPSVFAADAKGVVRAEVRITGAKAQDWEDVSVGPCSKGSCIYIADIGDNRAKRDAVTIYRVPEPAPGDSATAPAQVFRGRYPGGPEDAEAMWVTPDERVYIVTKGETGPVTIYRFPLNARSGLAVRLEKVAKLDSGSIERKEMITDADISPDGKWIVMRSKRALFFYRASSIRRGRIGTPLRFNLTGLGEPHGEGVTLAADGTVYLVGEGGGKGRPGTLGSLRCNLP
ncbi:MAG: hypothetical protein HY700_06880 [Gemmatimonadetes bacterium]|nr:hypothetical protein [Gemmatimonadota bacterium]